MATAAPLVLGVAGAVGGAAAFPAYAATAASIGFAIGSTVGQYAAQAYMQGPSSSQTVQLGARLQNLKVQNSAYGDAIPIVYGRVRIAGNVIWAKEIREEKVTTTQTTGGGGGKGGGGGGGGSTEVTQVSYKYYATLAVGLCEGPISGVVKVWADTKLLYNAEGNSATLDVSERLNATFYNGSETQQPDPTIEADKGAGNVPAYRGLAYVVIEDLPLDNFANRIPNFSFEVKA